MEKAVTGLTNWVLALGAKQIQWGWFVYKKQELVEEEIELVDNEVWEDLSPFAWRDSIYSDEAKDNCMGKLFDQEVDLFKDISVQVQNSQNYKRSALIEVGFGTAELFSKVDKDYDMVIGVELS